MIVLNEQQRMGLEIACQRFKAREKYTVIAGYAGTGKSTLVKFIIQALGVPEDQVVYCAYTGKATSVLASKGNKNTSTLHKLLYFSKRIGERKYIRRLREKLEGRYRVIVVDEVSMVPSEMLQHLLRFNIHILCLGDPFQIPPPLAEDNKVLYNPHIFLTEIMRQEADNQIIQTSFKIRNSLPLDKMTSRDVDIIQRGELTLDTLCAADQVLCATNETRQRFNHVMRQHLGRGEEPEIGDKIICMQNQWDTETATGDALINGTIGTIQDMGFYYDHILGCKIMNLTLLPDYAEKQENHSTEFIDIPVDYNFFKNGTPCLSWKEYKQKTKGMGDNKPIMPMPFAYGYVITTHKSQGSEFNNTIVIEEGFPYAKEEHARHLYTGATRAKEKLTITLKP